MSKYIGAKYIGNDPIAFGNSGRVANKGDICTELPEWEAIGRHDFEPVYDGETKVEKPAATQKKIKEA